MLFRSGEERTESGAESVDKGQIWLAVLVVLAIIASVIMLLTDSAAALKFALIAALWAAVIGFILVGRYRNQARAARDELVLREQALQAELAKARVEAEAAAAQTPAQVDLTLLEEIKQELAVVRAQLEELSGREFGFEPAALRAEARRIIELEARTYAAQQQRIDALSRRPEPQPDEPVEAEVDELPEIDDTPTPPSPDAIAGRLGSQPSPRTADLNPLSAIITEKARREEEEAARNQEQDRAEKRKKPAGKKKPGQAEAEEPAAPAAPEPAKPAAPAAPAARTPEPPKRLDVAETMVLKTPVVEAGPEPEAAGAPPEPAAAEHPESPADSEASESSGGGRRRRENTHGISVAELLARAKEQEEED